MSEAPGAGWLEMRLKGLILDPTSDVPVIILREVDGSVFLPIWIGVFEANAIALALEGIRTERPMTHDLLRSCLGALDADLERVEIHSLIEGTFHARLRLRRGGGGEAEPTRLEVDARPSDAVALALRVGAPIWIARTVLDQAVSSRKATEAPAGPDDERRLREWLENARPEDLGKYPM